MGNAFASKDARLNAGLIELFNIYDVDKSGWISLEENLKIDKHISEGVGAPFDEEESRRSYMESDTNKDGKVTLPEFLATDFFKSMPGLTAEQKLQFVEVVKTVLIPDRIEEAFAELFNIYDVDKNGWVSMEENIAMDKKFAEAMGMPFDEEQSKATFGDLTGDGRVTYQEFLADQKSKIPPGTPPEQILVILSIALQALRKEAIDQMLAELFQIYDMSKSGSISAQEYLYMEKKLNEALGKTYDEEEAKKEFAATDLNEDGKVTLQEFKIFAKSQFPAGADDELILTGLRQVKLALSGQCVVQ